MKTIQLIPSSLLAMALMACSSSKENAQVNPDSGSSFDASNDVTSPVNDSQTDVVISPKPLAKPFCAEGTKGWCWSNPLPQGNTLYQTWGTSNSDIWAVGEFGTILHWDGKDFQKHNSKTTERLTGIWGADAKNIWAIGTKGTVLFWNGTEWTKQSVETTVDIQAIWGVNATDVWIVGNKFVRRWDNNNWVSYRIGIDIQSVSGSSSTNVWVTNNSGGVWRYNNAGDWYPSVPLPAPYETSYLNRLWVLAADDVWVASSFLEGVVFHFDGAKWTAFEIPQSKQGFSHLWGNGPKDGWALDRTGRLFHWDGTSWTRSTDIPRTELPNTSIDRIDPSISAGWNANSNQAWFVGEGGFITQWNGTQWNQIAGGPVSIVRSVWSKDAQNTWAAVGNRVCSFNNSVWDCNGPQPGERIARLWGFDSTNIWALAYSNNVYQWNGTKWNSIDNLSFYYSDILSVKAGLWGASPNDIWAVGDTLGLTPYVHHWDGKAWSRVNVPESVQAVHGSSVNDVWAVGSAGNLIRWNGNSWSTIIPSGSTVVWSGVWANSPKDVWVSGYFSSLSKGIISHWDGTNWTPSYLGSSNLSVRNLWGRNTNDIWATQDGGNTLHWNGSEWKEVSTGTAQVFNQIYGTDSTNLWLVGRQGTILKYQP